MKRSFLKREKAAGTLPRGAGPEEQTQYSINRKKRPEFKREKRRKSIDRSGSACYPADRADVRDIRILAVSGAGRRDLVDRSVSQPLEKLMDSRKLYANDGDPEKALLPCEGAQRALLCVCPIIAAGDVTGAVGLLTEDRAAQPDAAQEKAAAVAAAFLAKQMEE